MYKTIVTRETSTYAMVALYVDNTTTEFLFPYMSITEVVPSDLLVSVRLLYQKFIQTTTVTFL